MSLLQRKWAKIVKNHHNFTLKAFWDKIYSISFGGSLAMTHTRNSTSTYVTRKCAAVWMWQIGSTEWKLLTNVSAFSEKNWKSLVNARQFPRWLRPISQKKWEREHLLKEGDSAKTPKAAKTTLKTTEKAPRNIEVGEEPSGKKKPKEPTSNTIWIADQRHAHEKLICQRTVRATTFSRPPLKSSRRGEFRSDWFIFLWSLFDLSFFKTSENMVPTKKNPAILDSPRRIL